MSTPLRRSDPCYWMLEQGRSDPSMRSRTTVYSARCSICRDPEYSLMGLPLCYPCVICGSHVAADDTWCSFCATDQEEAWIVLDLGFGGDEEATP